MKAEDERTYLKRTQPRSFTASNTVLMRSVLRVFGSLTTEYEPVKLSWRFAERECSLVSRSCA